MSDNSKVTPEFERNVSEWLELDDIESQSKKDLAEIRKRKSEVSQEILHYIKTHDINRVTVPGGAITRSISKRKSTKKDVIRENLLRSGALRDPNSVDQVIEYVYGNVPVVESEYLKRSGRAKNNDRSATVV